MSFPVQFLLDLQGELTVEPDLPVGSSTVLALHFFYNIQEEKNKALNKSKYKRDSTHKTLEGKEHSFSPDESKPSQ